MMKVNVGLSRLAANAQQQRIHSLLPEITVTIVTERTKEYGVLVFTYALDVNDSAMCDVPFRLYNAEDVESFLSERCKPAEEEL